jgi:uncharacterized membrane protein
MAIVVAPLFDYEQAEGVLVALGVLLAACAAVLVATGVVNFVSAPGRINRYRGARALFWTLLALWLLIVAVVVVGCMKDAPVVVVFSFVPLFGFIPVGETWVAQRQANNQNSEPAY